ncbi:MAG: hypothetical protein Kow0069_10070 [Promethearchaeota archaeon]
MAVAASLAVGVLGPLVLGALKDRVLKWAGKKGLKVGKRLAKWLKKKLGRVIGPESQGGVDELYDALKEGLDEVAPGHAPELEEMLKASFAELSSRMDDFAGKLDDFKELVKFELEGLEGTLKSQGEALDEELAKAKDELVAELDRKADFLLKRILESTKAGFDALLSSMGVVQDMVAHVSEKVDHHHQITTEQFYILVEKMTQLTHEVSTISTTIGEQAQSVRSVQRTSKAVETTTERRVVIGSAAMAGGSGWCEDSDYARRLRERMVEQIARSEMGEWTSRRVLRAMLEIPRHAFANLEFFKGVTSPLDRDLLDYVYNRHKAMPVTELTNSSAPEVVALMLSLFRLDEGDRVLFVGAKGGYIQCLAAHVVGPEGEVVVLSTDREAVRRNAELCECTPFGRQITWIEANTLRVTKPVIERAPFDSVFVCGAVPEIPAEYLALLTSRGSLVAPVGEDLRTQTFTVVERDGDQFRAKEVTDFKFVFGPVA